MTHEDALGRPLRSLRISVTDRCNLRCSYCMPEENYLWLEKRWILSFEEIALLVDAFIELGVDRVRLTGGEPLVRSELPTLVRLLAQREGLLDLSMTTNAILLEDQAEALRRAGLGRITVSLDTLQRARFEELTRRDDLGRALAGIRAARSAGFERIKLNAVVLRGRNDDELAELLEFARDGGHELRLIEYMDVGGATRWSPEAVVSRTEILARLERHFGKVRPLASDSSAPAERFALPDGTVFGIIASTTEPFCAHCDRSRLTADGKWFTCLYAREGIDLGKALRAGASGAQLVDLIRGRWKQRDDRGAIERLELAGRQPLARVDELRDDLHLEMHTRGG